MCDDKKSPWYDMRSYVSFSVCHCIILKSSRRFVSPGLQSAGWASTIAVSRSEKPSPSSISSFFLAQFKDRILDFGQTSSQRLSEPSNLQELGEPPCCSKQQGKALDCTNTHTHTHVKVPSTASSLREIWLFFWTAMLNSNPEGSIVGV